MEDPEDIYNEALEREDELFLEGLKQGKNLDFLEKEYAKKSNKLRRIYEKNNIRYLKNKPAEQKKKKKEEGGDKVFRVEHLNLEDTWKERIKRSKEYEGFRIKRKSIDFFEKVIPSPLLKFYFKIKKIFRIVFFELKMFFGKLFTKIGGALLRFFDRLKRILQKIASLVEKIGDFSKKLVMKKKKDSAKKEDKKDDEKGTKLDKKN